MLQTVGNSRTACIMLENGKLSTNFNLDSGRPQGEILSPIQYNVCNQILLLKIELDPRVQSIFNSFFGPRAPFPIECNNSHENRFFACESERKTDNVEGFADDSTAITLADQTSISAVEEILVNFENISGLVCNFSKSSITFFGNTESVDKIKTKFVKNDTFTLLGVSIDSNLTLLKSNFNKTKLAIQKIINFWGRFNLSLTGRIRIAKCFILSQINYLGCIITPCEDDLRWMQNSFDNFCTGNLRVGKEKLYLPPSDGGLGLVNLKNALVAQQAVWFKRAAKSTRDNWRYDLWVCGSGNCLTPDPDLLCQNGNPILYNLVTSFREFSTKFYLTANNFLDSFILNNPLFSTDDGFPYTLRTNFWLQNGKTNLAKLSRLRVRDFLHDGKMKSFVNINDAHDLNLSFTTYIRLTGLMNRALKKYIKMDEKSTPLMVFLNGFRKGSRPLRKILEKSAQNCIPQLKEAFSAVLGTPRIELDGFKITLGCWSANFISNCFGEFIFKFYHNRLGLNIRISHFTDNSRWCTFCSIVGKNMGPFPDESFRHFFLDCPSTQKIHQDINRTFFPNLDLDTGHWLGVKGNNLFLNLFLLAIQFQIWQARLNSNIPNSDFCSGEAIYLLGDAIRLNSKLLEQLNLLDCPLSRLWVQLTRPRW
jgi:hypothetical protein